VTVDLFHCKQAVLAMILCLAVSNDHSIGLAKALCLVWPCSDAFAPNVVLCTYQALVLSHGA